MNIVQSRQTFSKGIEMLQYHLDPISIGENFINIVDSIFAYASLRYNQKRTCMLFIHQKRIAHNKLLLGFHSPLKLVIPCRCDPFTVKLSHSYKICTIQSGSCDCRQGRFFGLQVLVGCVLSTLCLPLHAYSMQSPPAPTRCWSDPRKAFSIFTSQG